MSTEFELDVVYGSTLVNSMLLSSIVRSLRQKGVQGTFYIGYPVMASADSSTTIDALLVSQSPGLVAFHFVNAGTNYREEQDRLYYVLQSNLARHESLRYGRDLGVKINIISIFPEGEVPTNTNTEYRAASPSTITDSFKGMSGIIEEELYRKLSAAIQRVTTIKPYKKRQNVKLPDSKGAILKEIEKEIANLDRWQKAAAIETPDGPQRIRGLAGSGKTVVLALKAAYLHTQHPEWKIAVTFHTRSLYQQFKDLIERFTLEHLGDKPDWDNLHIVHSWGSSWMGGIYSIACNATGLAPYSYLSAKAKYGTLKAFEGVCDELAAAMKGQDVEIYDAVLIDEAQDLPRSFFRIIDNITKPPKRIVWAYDELQNLTEAGMASTPELFGREINLSNTPEAPHQDIILPVCYRNTPWALTLAHALGFGLFRDTGLVQHFDLPSMWMDIGYQVESGILDYGNDVCLSRESKSYPQFFSRLLTPEDAVVCNTFSSKEEQFSWIAEQVENNIKIDELDLDDILIILPQPVTQKEEYYALRRQLDSRNIPSALAGVTNDRDMFTQTGMVTVSGIYRAKGNEAPMVYIANSDYSAMGHEMIRIRNILFTSITRSRAWVRICGVGQEMETLCKEVNRVISNNYKLTFRVPSQSELQNMRRINRDKTAQEKSLIRKAERNLEELIELVRNGVISPEAMPQIKELMRAMRIQGEE